MKHAQFLINHVPNMNNSCAMDLVLKTVIPRSILRNAHIWGSPCYGLDPSSKIGIGSQSLTQGSGKDWILDGHPTMVAYIKLPQGYENDSGMPVMLKLHKSLNGMLDAPLMFFELPKNNLIDCEFKQLDTIDPCLFVHKDAN